MGKFGKLAAAAILIAGTSMIAGQASAKTAARAPARASSAGPATIAGHPNINGVWQAMSGADFGLEPHSAETSPGPQSERELGAIAAIPASLGVVEGSKLSGRLRTVQHHTQSDRMLGDAFTQQADLRSAGRRVRVRVERPLALAAGQPRHRGQQNRRSCHRICLADDSFRQPILEVSRLRRGRRIRDQGSEGGGEHFVTTGEVPVERRSTGTGLRADCIHGHRIRSTGAQ